MLDPISNQNIWISLRYFRPQSHFTHEKKFKKQQQYTYSANSVHQWANKNKCSRALSWKFHITVFLHLELRVGTVILLEIVLMSNGSPSSKNNEF